MQVNVEFLKFIIDQIFKLFVAFNEVTALLEQYECMCLSWYFQQKPILRLEV